MGTIIRNWAVKIGLFALVMMLMGVLSFSFSMFRLPDQVLAGGPGNQQVYLPVAVKDYSLPSRVVWNYRGASIAGYWKYAYAPQGNVYFMIDQLKAEGVNAVSILATWYQDGLTTSQIAPGPMTPRDEDLIALIQYAHRQGMQVVLKPHIDPFTGWRGHIVPTNPNEWFNHFTSDFLLHYAQIAEAQRVEIFVIGTEYDALVKSPYINYWASVVNTIRQVYHGQVTYAATENSLFKDNLPDWFWQSLDLVSLTFYHDFSQARTPGVAEIVQRWKTDGVLENLQQIHQKYGKPVLLAEVGYRSIDYAGVEAWRTEGPNGNGTINPEQSIAYNGEGQTHLYESLFQVLGNQDWIAGIFMWQFVPSGGCAGMVRGGTGNTDYAIFGKPSAQTVHSWFGGTSRPSSQWISNPIAPLVHSFEFNSADEATYGWELVTSGQIALAVDSTTHPPLPSSTRSLRIDTIVPQQAGRFQQMDYYFCDGDRDWRGYNSLELWVRPDSATGDSQGCELAVGLVDGRSQDREYWQSSQWLARAPLGTEADGWRRIQIALSGSVPPERDPWRHPTDFVVPTWSPLVNQSLDLAAIRGVRIKTLTADGDSSATCRVWLGPMRASTDLVEIVLPPSPPFIDKFEYQQAATAGRIWQAPAGMPGTIEFFPDPGRYAPGTGSTLSLHIHTSIPCTQPRYEQVTNFLLGGGVDLSAYNSLELWAGGDLLNQPPYGGEFSIVIEDEDGEFWQSTRWLGRTIQGLEYAPSKLEPVRLSLVSYIPDPSQNPWFHPVDFVLTQAGNTSGNHQLDRKWIRGITLKTLTTNERCQTTPDFDVWVDHLVASPQTVTPPELIHLPHIDHFEYADNETARLIWKWVSSGLMNITMDSTIHAPESSRSMRIFSDVPAGTGRYAQVANVFLTGVQDFSGYNSLRFWARTANGGGEVSIELVETDPVTGHKETWRNTRWFEQTGGQWISIPLVAGASVPADPWLPKYANAFVVPPYGSYGDGILDLRHITEIRIMAASTDPNVSIFNVWVDEMTLN